MNKTFYLMRNDFGDIIDVDATKVGKSWRALCPFHDDRNPSLSISEEKGVYHCFGCDKNGRLSDGRLNRRHIEVEHADFRSPSRRIVGEYSYKDQNGVEVYQVVRLEPKSFFFRHKDASGKWVNNAEGLRRYPYRLPEILNSMGTVFIVEGEKDVDTLVSKGLTATTNAGGAGKWDSEFAQYLKGRDVVILPDNDEPGKEHAESVAATLIKTAASVKIVGLPGLGEKEDVSDWLQILDNTVDKLASLAALVTPQVIPSSQERTGDMPSNSKVIYMSRFYPRPYALEIMGSYLFFSVSTSSDEPLYYYDFRSGLWKSDGTGLVSSYFRTQSEALDIIYRQTRYIKEIEMDIRGCKYELGTNALPEPDPNLIPCKNGVFDLSTNQLRAYSPKDYFTWKHPFDYNPKAKNDLVEFVETFIPSNKSEDLFDLMSYTLWRGYPYQKFFFLNGSGSNGKSLFQTIYINMLGSEQVVSLSLESIQFGNYAAAELHRKLLNISGEVGYEDLSNDRLLKQLTGGDMITADRKYLNSIKYLNHAKQVFLMNSVPQTTDTSDGFYRRAYLIDFPCKFEENPQVMDAISNVNEMQESYEGLFYYVIRNLVELKKRNFHFRNEKPLETRREEYQQKSNPLLRFIHDKCEMKTNGETPKKEFQERFSEWLDSQRLTRYTPTRLGRSMKALGYEEGKTTQKESGERLNCWKGIILNE